MFSQYKVPIKRNIVSRTILFIEESPHLEKRTVQDHAIATCHFFLSTISETLIHHFGTPKLVSSSITVFPGPSSQWPPLVGGDRRSQRFDLNGKKYVLEVKDARRGRGFGEDIAGERV